ncbi:unnamed protein product [Allacma fusca]|uniref:Uncharacterized protein n=1 Tax=Allacma fusca TaxID=39272 RepID=A0A8J2KY94_9HEXA|nr:unnamed protein product [Allacma fusca]
MEPLPRPFLSTVKGKLDRDLRANLESKWLPPLKSAIRQLKMSEEEEKGFIIDIRKYAETISPQELRQIPRNKVLPFLLHAIWKFQVRAAQTESEDQYGEGFDDEEENNEGSDVEEELTAEDLAVAEQSTKPASPEFHMRQQRYKILLDKVAPFYIERRSEQVFEKSDVDILSRKNLSRAVPVVTTRCGQNISVSSSSKQREDRCTVASLALQRRKVTLLQSGPCDIRGTTFRIVGSSLGPGDYDVTSSIQELLNKRISTRGPYDLFTQPNRFDVLHGYFKRPKLQLEPGMYGVHGSLKDILNSRCNLMKGRLSKMNRDQKVTGERIAISNPMWPTVDSEKQPGPGHYNIHDPEYKHTCWGENYWAFNISTEARPDLPSDYDNAPTRYRPEMADRSYCATGCGFKSNFRSKSTRLDFNKNSVLSERLRPKDIPPKEKARIVDECRWFL